MKTCQIAVLTHVIEVYYALNVTLFIDIQLSGLMIVAEGLRPRSSARKYKGHSPAGNAVFPALAATAYRAVCTVAPTPCRCHGEGERFSQIGRGVTKKSTIAMIAVSELIAEVGRGKRLVTRTPAAA